MFTFDPSSTQVLYPVPVDFVPDVTALLDRLTRETSSEYRHDASEPHDHPGAPDGKDAVPGSASTQRSHPGIAWTPAQLDRLLAKSHLSARRVFAQLDAIAAQSAGTYLSSTALAEATGETLAANKHALSWLGKYSLRAAEEGELPANQWPMGWAYGANINEDRPFEFHYFMSEEQKKAWLDARG
jgi:hypothetical protein